MKKIILLFATFIFVWYLVQEKPKQTVTNWNASYNGIVHQLSKDLKNYNCRSLKRLPHGELKFCEGKTVRDIPIGESKVSGEYYVNTTTILVEHGASNDVKVHELLHHVNTCTRVTKDEELCVRETQKFLLELDLIRL